MESFLWQRAPLPPCNVHGSTHHVVLVLQLTAVVLPQVERLEVLGSLLHDGGEGDVVGRWQRPPGGGEDLDQDFAWRLAKRVSQGEGKST